jgi:cyclophilin family peptidyl-prolyl cis-trans isomerase
MQTSLAAAVGPQLTDSQTAAMLTAPLLSAAASSRPPYVHRCLRMQQSPAVVFGRVVEGMAVVQRMESMGSSSGRPKLRVTIADCGQVRVSASVRPSVSQSVSQSDRQSVSAGGKSSSSSWGWGILLCWHTAIAHPRQPARLQTRHTLSQHLHTSHVLSSLSACGVPCCACCLSLSCSWQAGWRC